MTVSPAALAALAQVATQGTATTPEAQAADRSENIDDIIVTGEKANRTLKA